MRLLTLLTILTVAVACGQTPTAPAPCTAATAVRVDTAWYPNGKVAMVVYDCAIVKP